MADTSASSKSQDSVLSQDVAVLTKEWDEIAKNMLSLEVRDWAFFYACCLVSLSVNFKIIHTREARECQYLLFSFFRVRFVVSFVCCSFSLPF